MQVKHTLKPYYNKDSEILILGTMPSPKSRELGFYYMHPQNRFWPCLAIVFEEDIPDDIESKKEFLKRHKIALWDTCAVCEISGSRDSSITKVIPNDLTEILKNSQIKEIYTTGKKSYELYNKYIYPQTKIKAIYLYSSSPLNCAIKMDKLVENYQVINKSQK